MTHVAVVVDSTASLPQQVLDDNQMLMVPYYVHLPGHVYRDMVDLQPADLEAYMLGLEGTEGMPTTANPGPGDYEQAYVAAAERAPSILSFHMTSVGSGAYQAACVARDMLKQRLANVTIHPVDTRNVSMCHGWIALLAARAARAGADLGDVLNLVNRLVPVARMIQTADTLKYLYLGGRIGRAKHLVSALLNIKPLISMDDGVITTLGITRTRKRALTRMAELVQEQVGETAIRLALTHFGARDEAQKLADMMRQGTRVVEEMLCELSPALCVHSGPGTVGLCYVPLREP